MGVGGNFWDMLKPYARTEGFDFLRNKRVAIDLSFWIVQHETAIKVHTRNPHIRLTFFRTINLFSKFGAFPVFVVDGTPSPLKSEARIMRFFQSSGISLPVSDGTSVERNNKFLKCVQECVELLELFGMPVVKAIGEAEGVCAELNKQGLVDACITSDSDVFLFGAKCIIKRLQPNSKEPFECYDMSDIEAGLGLKRNHLIAIALLVGNDYDLKGVQGIGLQTALSFVKLFDEDEVLDRLGGGNTLTSSQPKTRDCSSSDHDKKAKKKQAWKIRVCKKIATHPNFPNNEIIQIYLNDHHTDAEPIISWKNPSTEMLIDYVAFKLNWEPSFIRQKLFPLLSTIFLRNKAAKNQETDLLYGQYEFDCIQRTKIRFGHPFYLVSWKKSVNYTSPSIDYVDESVDDADVTNVCVNDGCLMTDENVDLVFSAYPEKVDQFMQQKERKNGKAKAGEDSRSVQLNITQFYRSSKGETIKDDAKRNASSRKFSKSARRRLLLD